MTSWHHIQRSFSGGEISPTMLMRQDDDFYKQSALAMINMIPTPRGSAQRLPGTRYLQDAGNVFGRIIPYLTPANEKSLLLFIPGQIKLLRNITDRLEEGALNILGDPGVGIITYKKQSITNYNFETGLENWIVEPDKYTSENGEGPLGVFWRSDDNTLLMRPREFTVASDARTVTAETTAVVDVATDTLIVDWRIDYKANPPDSQGGFDLTFTVSPNTDYSNPILEVTYDETEYPVAGGSIELGEQTVSLAETALGAGWTGNLYVKVEATATSVEGDQYSNPQFELQYVSILSDGETELVETNLSHPYSFVELRDLHYVQSPYGSKELVITHPQHAPKKFWFNTGIGAYEFVDIPFTDAPSEWTQNNYPASCTSYNGRLILAGGQQFEVTTGTPVAAVAETVWGSKAGEWEVFTAGANPDDPLEFVAIYRSPIQWVHGHKSLLVGALEYEYSADSDTVASPGDLGIYLHSTHGSSNVQPAAFGEGVLFAADAGKKLRSLTYSDENKGWLATDLTLLRPEACLPEVLRIARVRTPQQMCWVVKTDGEISIFSSESGAEGWSRFITNNGRIRDICVVQDRKGRDVVFMLVHRYVQKQLKLYLEAIPASAYEQHWGINDSCLYFAFDQPTTVISGLDHLEGKRVQVSTRRRYLGTWIVNNGQITLSDNAGTFYTVQTAVVGLMHRCQLNTLPPEKQDPGSKSRYSEFAARCLFSTRPIINDERPPDREPQRPMNNSQPLDLIRDVEVSTRGWTPYDTIEISEQIPFRLEVLGIYGKLKSNAL